MKRALAAVLGAGLLLAGCGQSSIPAATSTSGTYGDGLDHSWTASTAEGQRLYAALSQGLKSQDFNIGLSITATNGWGPIELNTSNGETPAGDGKPITLNGQVYSTGLGVHANSEIHIHATNLETPACTRFQADVGIDDEVGDKGSVVFQVFADGVKLFDSGVMTGASATQHIDVGIGNKSDLRFVVTDAGDNNYYDHADWAGAQLSCATVVEQNNRPTVTGLSGNTELSVPGTNVTLLTTVTITGTNLQNAAVQFGSDFGYDYYGTDVAVSNDGTRLTVIAPPNRTEKVPIVVITPYGKVNAGIYTNLQTGTGVSVHLLTLNPTSGPSVGGTVVKLTSAGVYFYGEGSLPKSTVPIVYFGGVQASNVYFDTDGMLNAVSPPGTGEVDVKLKCPLQSCRTFSTTESLPFLYTP